ncbi:DUF2155 domain-containing protein [Pseudolabrys taiwanensis]|uniref:DUF2155 domain-containing protein n=1 Tax=Pseudolabrys taiwanensis TaxID=331696 RepID=A0A345ZU55_9HYPH|nr:DUF2155 domain-containing protein [Pseudolabrys taiwanensis]AXK80452.1 DUF2155 domain-containing protein [Pseudolabrys taiwanensis]
MARPRLSVCILTLATLAAATPALAQFGSIFSDSPPRPPANVPGGGRDDRYPPPIYREEDDEPPPPPSRQAPYYSNQPSRMPAAARPDVPPAQPLPAPMALPPSSRPGGGTIQSQDLAPPPGATMAPLPGQVRPPAPAGEQPQQPTQANTNPNPNPNPNQPADTAPRPGDEVVVEPPPQRIANPTAVFSGLDKITGRIISFDVAINETVQFGALQVTPRVCYSRPPTETPNTDAFVEVDEVTLQNEMKRIFSGWMFAASPGLHAVEHPIYDVWLTDCKGAQPPSVAEAAPDDQAKPAARPTQPRRAQPAQRPPQAGQQFVPAQPRAQQQQPGFVPALR